MTSLSSKELITSNKCASSPQFSDELTVEKVHNDHFKNLMYSSEQEEEELEEKVSEEGASLNAFMAQHPCGMALGIQAQTTLSLAGTAALTSPGLSIEISEMFEKMASTMLLLSSSEERETTLFLEGPKFTTSPFFGTRITIKEFSFAPKAFNIEIASHPTALNLIAAHKGALLAAFEGGRFPFTIHRLETQLHAIDETVSSDRYDSDEEKDQKKDDS